MEKIIFREVTPEAVETDILFDDDFIRGKGGDGYENGILYIVTGDDYAVTNKKEWEALCSLVDNLVSDFNALMGNDHYYFRNYKEVLQYYGIKYSPVMVHKLKKFAESYDDRSIEDIAEYLTITTGEKWETYTVTGYCQGDYATGIYCTKYYDPDSLELYVGAAAGTVSEFCRIEGGDECYGFFVPDSVKWNTDELRTYLSKQWGDNEENITLELFDGYTQTAKYTEA
jgi:hypothetical protein